MPPFVDLTNRRFGRLTVTCKATGAKRLSWNCSCSCGGTAIVVTNQLNSGKTKSCGCLQKESAIATGKKNITHGMRYTVEYQTWIGMCRRCTDKKRPDFKEYGARGITVCSRWRHSFESFFSDMGLRPKDKTSIDRIDNDGEYSPENCRWATAFDQNRNKRGCRYITHNGITKTFSEWSISLGGANTLVQQRISKGWSEQKAVTTPTQRKKQ